MSGSCGVFTAALCFLAALVVHTRASCTACILGQYNAGCTGGVGGTCVDCGVCALGYGRTGCKEQSPGSCILGTDTYAIVTDVYNRAIRKLDLVTNQVSTLGSWDYNGAFLANGTVPKTDSKINYYAESILLSRDEKTAIFSVPNQHIIMKLDMRVNQTSVFAGYNYMSGSVDDVGASATLYTPSNLIMSRDYQTIYFFNVGDRLLRKIDYTTQRVSTLTRNSQGVSIVNNQISLAITPDEKAFILLDGNQVKMCTIANPAVISVISEGALSSPYGIDIASSGLFAVINDLGNRLIRRFDLRTYAYTSIVSTSDMSMPLDIKIFYNDTMALVPDINTNQIYLVDMARNTKYLFAGSSAGLPGMANGPGLSAQFNYPRRLYVTRCNTIQKSVEVCSICPLYHYYTGDGVSTEVACIRCEACLSTGTYKTDCFDTSPGTCVTCSNLN